MFGEMRKFSNPAEAETVKSSEQQSKEKEAGSSADKIFDTLSYNYVDSEGNLIGWQEFDYNTNPHYKILREQLDEAKEYELESFLYNPKNLETLIAHIDNARSSSEKVVLIKLLGDLIESVIRDEEDKGGFVKKAQSTLKQIANDENENYFIRSFAYTIYSSNLELENWYTDDFEEADEIERGNDILELHETQFDNINFEFTSEMINKMNYESRDYGAPTQMMNSFEARPGEDYLTVTMAPQLVGIFSRKGSLIGWQNFEEENLKKLAQLSNEEEKLFDEWDGSGKEQWKKIFPLLNQKSKENKFLLESPVRIKDQIEFTDPREDLAAFKILLSLSFRNKIKNDLGIDLANYNLRTQYQFLRFIKEHKKSEVEALNIFISKSTLETAKNKIRAFLSSEIDFNNGKRILTIGEKLPEKDADAVFAKVAELINLAESESKEFKKLLTEENITLSGIQLELLKRAHQIILDFSGSGEDIDKILKELEQSKIEIIILSALFKSFKERGIVLNFEDIRGLELSYVESAVELSDEEKEEMIAMADVNWNQIKTLKDVVVSGLRADLESNKKQKIYILRYQGKIASFIRFEETDRGTIYAGSFNVKTELRGVDVGNEMIGRTLIAESQQKEDGKYPRLEGTVSPRISVGTNYVEDVGFVINGIIVNYHKTGEPLFTLELDNNINSHYQARSEGKESEITVEKLKGGYREYGDIKELTGEDIMVLRYDMKKDWEKMMSELSELLINKDDKLKDLPIKDSGAKYKITRYFRDKKQSDGDLRYLVLEKVA